MTFILKLLSTWFDHVYLNKKKITNQVLVNNVRLKLWLWKKFFRLLIDSRKSPYYAYLIRSCFNLKPRYQVCHFYLCGQYRPNNEKRVKACNYIAAVFKLLHLKRQWCELVCLMNIIVPKETLVCLNGDTFTKVDQMTQ